MNHPVHNMAYISGPLNDLNPEQREKFYAFYRKLGEVCEEFGLFAFLPHKYGDPVTTKALTPKQINSQDRTAVTKSRILIAYLGLPSTGTGIEIEMAYHAHVPVIVIYEESIHPSRLALGSPGVTNIITFKDEAECLSRLRAALQQFCQSQEILALPEPLTFRGSGEHAQFY